MSNPRRIIPFGKYKGQPVEVLATDRQYLEWLQAQPWFPERFSAIHTLVVNNFGESECTPEHNKLQSEFLDPAIQLSIWSLLFPDRDFQERMFQPRVEIEPTGFDVLVSAGIYTTGDEICPAYIECKPTIGEDFPAILRKMKVNRSRIKALAGCRIAIVFDRFVCDSVDISAVEKAFRTSSIFMFPISEIRANALKFRKERS